MSGLQCLQLLLEISSNLDNFLEYIAVSNVLLKMGCLRELWLVLSTYGWVWPILGINSFIIIQFINSLIKSNNHLFRELQNIGEKSILENFIKYTMISIYIILNNQQIVEMLEDPRVQKDAECFKFFPSDNQDDSDLFKPLFNKEETIYQELIQMVACPRPYKLFWEDQRPELQPSSIVLQDTDESKDASSFLGRKDDGNRHDDQQKNTRSRHNIFGYVTNSAIKIMLNKYKKKIRIIGAANGFSLKEFQHILGSKRNYMYGPEGFKKLFEGNIKRKMIKLFWKLFKRILRKDYIIYAWSKGKMKEHQMYIQTKNKYLLYVQELMEQMREQILI